MSENLTFSVDFPGGYAYTYLHRPASYSQALNDKK